MRERIVRTVAGTFVLISLVLAFWVSNYWLWFTAFDFYVPNKHL